MGASASNIGGQEVDVFETCKLETSANSKKQSGTYLRLAVLD
jgi:hypothetical protein